MTDIASILAPIKEALETGRDLALEAQQQVGEALAGYLPRKHAAAQKDVDVMVAGLAALEALQAERDKLLETQRKFGTLMHELMNERDALRVALNWYADEARALAKNTGSAQHHAPHAIMASVSVLALDNGFRADAAISAQTTKEA